MYIVYEVHTGCKLQTPLSHTALPSSYTPPTLFQVPSHTGIVTLDCTNGTPRHHHTHTLVQCQEKLFME